MEKKMIKLISPKMSKRPMDSHFKVQMSPPLCLLVLAGLTPLQYEVYVEDENGAGSFPRWVNSVS